MLSEEQLVAAAQSGNLESFASLYERYHSPMVALAYSLSGNRDVADDAAQEAFAIACRNLPQLKSKDKFPAWLAAICRNTVRQMLRSAARAGVQDLPVTAEDGDDAEHRHEAVRRAVWRLRPSEREIVVMRYFDGFSQAQISSVLGLSPQAVNGRLARAKKKIAGYLKHDGFAGDDHGTP